MTTKKKAKRKGFPYKDALERLIQKSRISARRTTELEHLTKTLVTTCTVLGERVTAQEKSLWPRQMTDSLTALASWVSSSITTSLTTMEKVDVRLTALEQEMARLRVVLPQRDDMAFEQCARLFERLTALEQAQRPADPPPWMKGDARKCALCGRDGDGHAQGNNNTPQCRGYSPVEKLAADVPRVGDVIKTKDQAAALPVGSQTIQSNPPAGAAAYVYTKMAANGWRGDTGVSWDDDCVVGDTVARVGPEPTATVPSWPQCPRCKQFHVAEDPQMTWRRVLETTPPDGQVWRCPCCPSWASLSENAHAHGVRTGHGFPLLGSAPAAPSEDPVVVAQGMRASLDAMHEDSRLCAAVVDAALAHLACDHDPDEYCGHAHDVLAAARDLRARAKRRSGRVMRKERQGVK